MRFFDAFGGIFQRDFDADLQIRALIVLLAAAAPASAEHLAEDVGKVEALRAAEPAKTAESARAAAHALFERGMAVLVVHGAFFFVGQGVVGFLNFFKFFLPLLCRRDCGRGGISSPACGRLFLISSSLAPRATPSVA